MEYVHLGELWHLNYWHIAAQTKTNIQTHWVAQSITIAYQSSATCHEISAPIVFSKEVEHIIEYGVKSMVALTMRIINWTKQLTYVQ